MFGEYTRGGTRPVIPGNFGAALKDDLGGDLAASCAFEGGLCAATGREGESKGKLQRGVVVDGADANGEVTGEDLGVDLGLTVYGDLGPDGATEGESKAKLGNGPKEDTSHRSEASREVDV